MRHGVPVAPVVEAPVVEAIADTPVPCDPCDAPDPVALLASYSEALRWVGTRPAVHAPAACMDEADIACAALLTVLADPVSMCQAMGLLGPAASDDYHEADTGPGADTCSARAGHGPGRAL